MGKLVTIAERARNLKGHGLDEGISTRMLIYAGSLIGQGVEPVSTDPVKYASDLQHVVNAIVAKFPQETAQSVATSP